MLIFLRFLLFFWNFEIEQNVVKLIRFCEKIPYRTQIFSGYWTNGFKVRTLNYIRKLYFHKCKKILKKFKCIAKKII